MSSCRSSSLARVSARGGSFGGCSVASRPGSGAGASVFNMVLDVERDGGASDFSVCPCSERDGTMRTCTSDGRTSWREHDRSDGRSALAGGAVADSALLPEMRLDLRGPRSRATRWTKCRMRICSTPAAASTARVSRTFSACRSAACAAATIFRRHRCVSATTESSTALDRPPAMSHTAVAKKRLSSTRKDHASPSTPTR
eukprot:scaffold8599_cov110-Isochrysis_galbana.AAC.6